jgi:hypothetical protein
MDLAFIYCCLAKVTAPLFYLQQLSQRIVQLQQVEDDDEASRGSPIHRQMKMYCFIYNLKSSQYFIDTTHNFLQLPRKGDLVRNVGICATPSIGPNCPPDWEPKIRRDCPILPL